MAEYFSPENKVTVISDESLTDIEAHLLEMNRISFKLVSSIHRGNSIILFWEKVNFG